MVLHLGKQCYLTCLNTTIVLNGEVLAFALLTLLGGNDDHTVGSTATIEGGSGSTFKHCHALDVVRRDARDTTSGLGVTLTGEGSALQGHTINNIEWLVTTIDRTETTDDNRVGSTWVTRSGLHLQTGNLTIQRVHGVGGVSSRDVVGFHLLSSITQRFLLTGNTHSSNHNLF